MKTVPVPDLLLILDRLALDLRLNVTINVTGIGEYIFLHCQCIRILMEHGSAVRLCPDTALVVQEVFPGSGPTLGVQAEDSYISLPGELFKNLKKSGLQALKSVIL